MTRQKIRFGLIGCGLMGREFASAAARWCHLTGMNIEPGIVAVCDTNESVLEWYAENLPSLEQKTTDYKELLANPAVDAVYCAVPHNLHEQIYVDTIEAGKHLLGEKPFGIDLRANAAIVSTAKRAPHLVVRCSSEFPFYPGAQRVIRMAREGAFGTILEVEAGFLHSSDMDPDKPINWKRMIRFNGEYGCMGDLGMHVLHIPLRLGWVPANVRAVLSNVVPERRGKDGKLVPCETWDNATLLCEVDSGGSSFPMTLKTQRIAPGETNTWYITVKGTKNSARFSTKYPKTLETMPYQAGGPQSWRREDLGYSPVYPAITGGIFEFGFSDGMQQMMAAFCEQVEKGSEAELAFGCATVEETRIQHRLFTAALESQRTKQVVEL